MQLRKMTLIELLIVIAVISVLLSLLASSLSTSRERGLESRCKEQLRQAGLLLTAQLEETQKIANRDESVEVEWIRLPCGCRMRVTRTTVTTKILANLNLTGCTKAIPNPLAEFDPAAEKELSFGIRNDSIVVFQDPAQEWYLACSDSNMITVPNDIAFNRHLGKANVFFRDGHVTAHSADSLPWPDAEPQSPAAP